MEFYGGVRGFTPVGTNTSNFTGRFDGLGHTITNLNINRGTTDYVGLFGYIGSGGAVSNVGLVGGSIRGQQLCRRSGRIYSPK